MNHMSFDAKAPFKLPPLPPRADFEDPKLLKQLVKARTELGELNGYSMGLPNPMLLVSPAIIQESVASSEIEAIHTTVLDVLQMELFPTEEQRSPDKEVLRYRDAMRWGFENHKKYALSNRLILGLHTNLLENSEGEYRRIQNQIKNTMTGETIYTPPASNEIPGLMKNWEEFVNDDQSEIDPLFRCAIAHYQFEAIHPFLGGNGRAGRILMILHLINMRVLTLPVLYISGFLNENRKDYYATLRGVTTHQKWKEFFSFMLQAFSLQAIRTKETLFKMTAQYEALKTQCQKELPKIYSADLINCLFSQPVTTPVRLAEALNIHYTTASRHLLALAKLGLLKNKKVGKYHLFVNHKLISLLKG